MNRKHSQWLWHHSKMGRNIFILNAFLVFFWITSKFAAGDDAEEEYCDCIGMLINGDAAGCSSDAIVVASLSITQVPAEGDGPEQVYLTGMFNVTKEIPKDDAVTVTINLELVASGGRETVWSGSTKFCEIMEKKEEPFKDISDIFHGECHIVVDLYEVPKMYLNMDFLTEYLTEDWLGSYILTLQIGKGLDVYLCMDLGAVVDVMQKKCDRCPSDSRRRK